jgi:hypothetical protein
LPEYRIKFGILFSHIWQAEPTFFFFCCCFSLTPLHRLDGFLPSSNVVVPVPGVVGIKVVLLLSFDIMDVQVRLPVYLNMLLQAVFRMNELSEYFGFGFGRIGSDFREFLGKKCHRQHFAPPAFHCCQPAFGPTALLVCWLSVVGRGRLGRRWAGKLGWPTTSQRQQSVGPTGDGIGEKAGH